MSKKDVQDYLEKGMYGTPQLKPDEQRKYLGTFRERIFLALTIKEMKDKKALTVLTQELKENPNHQLLLNAAVGFSIQNDYMRAAQTNNCEFKIVDTENQKQPDAIGLVYATDYAVNIDDISMTKHDKQKPTATNYEEKSAPAATKKDSWFAKFFQ